MAAEMLAASDVDYLNIDMQHGAVGYEGAVLLGVRAAAHRPEARARAA